MSEILTTIVPSRPWFLWNSTMSLKAKSQMTSLFSTKNGSALLARMSRASANGPAEKIRCKSKPLYKILHETTLGSTRQYHYQIDINIKPNRQVTNCSDMKHLSLLRSIWHLAGIT